MSVENTELTPSSEQVEDNKVIVTLRKSATAAETNWPQIQTSVTKALAALSGVKEITTDEQDEHAKNLLVKVSTTYKRVNALRTEITKPLDEIKDEFMGPERKINVDGKDNEYIRVKLLRDAYATKKSNDLKAETKRIADELAGNNELSRIRGELQKLVENGVLMAVQAMQEGIVKFWGMINLDNYDAAVLKFAAPVELKRPIYDGWFYCQYDEKLVAAAAFGGLVLEFKSRYPYDAMNTQYKEQAAPVLKEWTDKLPALKATMDEAETKRKKAEEALETARKNREAAEKLLQDEKDEELRVQKKKDADALKLKEDEAQRAQTNLAATQLEAKTTSQAEVVTQAAAVIEKLEEQIAAKTDKVEKEVVQHQTTHHFKAQAKTQELKELEGVKTSSLATLVCPEEEVVVALSELIYQCMIHPKFKGLVKRDDKGDLLFDATNNRPVYEDWAETLLSFYANNCADVIPQVQVTEKVTTIQKATAAKK